jgi:putative Ca2+/H+ antiporter (TMEM165/GDT1 family)
MRAYLAVFVSVFVAELGDKTQLATMLFATNPEITRVGVFVAAASALVASTALAVFIGAATAHLVAPQHLRLVAGAGFVLIGVWLLLTRG